MAFKGLQSRFGYGVVRVKIEAPRQQIDTVSTESFNLRVKRQNILVMRHKGVVLET